MIVVDTSVWVEFFRGTGSAPDLHLRELIAEDAPIALTEMILTELLQGFKNEREAREAERNLLAYPLVKLESPGDFVLAAKIYRAARRAGHTIRRTLDCLIAAPCVRNGFPVFHRDADFTRIAACSPLAIYQPPPFV